MAWTYLNISVKYLPTFVHYYRQLWSRSVRLLQQELSRSVHNILTQTKERKDPVLFKDSVSRSFSISVRSPSLGRSRWWMREARTDRRERTDGSGVKRCVEQKLTIIYQYLFNRMILLDVKCGTNDHRWYCIVNSMMISPSAVAAAPAAAAIITTAAVVAAAATTTTNDDRPYRCWLHNALSGS